MNFSIVLQILQVGSIGLAFLLAFMAYRLLQRESEKKAPSGEIINATTKYMTFAILLSLVAVLGQAANTYVGSRAGVAGSTGVEDTGGLREMIEATNARIDGITLEAVDAGTSAGYGCGGSDYAETDTLTVMYGLRDGTSCGVQNINYYKKLQLNVPGD